MVVRKAASLVEIWVDLMVGKMDEMMVLNTAEQMAVSMDEMLAVYLAEMKDGK